MDLSAHWRAMPPEDNARLEAALLKHMDEDEAMAAIQVVREHCVPAASLRRVSERTERAARSICDEGIMAMDGKPATWERHRDGFMAMAERALAAADRGAVSNGPSCRALAQWLVALDEPGASERRTITLTQVIEQARAALAADAGAVDAERWPQEAIDAAVHEMPGPPIRNRNVLASAVRGLLDAGYAVVPAPPRGAVEDG